MARAKRCEEEFNPWPPFVDVFSSVVLVLLLFILVLIVNVAYYTQFNAKIESVSQVKSKNNNLQAGMDTTEMISLHKVVKPKLDAGGKASLFSGGKSEGNALSTQDQKSQPQMQHLHKVASNILLIGYEGQEVFLQKSIQSKIKNFLTQTKKKGEKVVISMAYPTNLISTTMKKRVSISRVIDVKNSLKKMGVKLKDIKINIRNNSDPKYPNGYVKIKISQN